MKKFRIVFVKFIINHFLSGTHFFSLKRLLLNSVGIKVGNSTKIVGPIFFGSEISIQVGNNCWLGKNLNLDGNGKIIIGNNIDIAPNVTINTGGHIIGSSIRRAGEGIITSVQICDGCWIGTNVTIVNNTVVGKGSVVAAGSVVINDISKNVMVAGVPAKIKRQLDN